jgi:hypothetical protein
MGAIGSPVAALLNVMLRGMRAEEEKCGGITGVRPPEGLIS